MAYNDGRIYVDTSTNPDTGVSIGDLQQCFHTVIQGTVNGEQVRRLSSDLGVIISRRRNGESQEKYFTDNGVQWEVISRAEINPWARYRPIPCRIEANNTCLPLTDTQRLQENFGIKPVVDMYTADDVTQAENHANHVWNNGFDLQLYDFGPTHWKRLTDFVKTDNNGQAVHNVGYDHNAQPDNVVVTIEGENYSIQPLIPEGQRDIYAPKGRTVRFQFPNDQEWVDEYYHHVYRFDPSRPSKVTNIYNHPEWLSPMDLMGMNYYKPNDIVGVLRGVYIYKWQETVSGSGNGSWKLVNRVWNTITKESYSTTYSEATKRSFLDLTQMDDGSYNNIDYYMELQYGLYLEGQGEGVEIDANAMYKMASYYDKTYDSPSNHHDVFLWNLEGEYLFVEFWKKNVNTEQYLMPIPGLCYTVHIYRNSVPSVSIDIPGIVEFLYAKSEGRESSQWTAPIRLYLRILTSELTSFQNNVVKVLKNYYSVLTSTTDVNNQNLNESMNFLTDFGDGTYDSGAFWVVSTADGYTTFRVAIGESNDDFDFETEPVWTTTITARQKSAVSNQSKVFNVDRSYIYDSL